jgi:hypothetical protein
MTSTANPPPEALDEPNRIDRRKFIVGGVAAGTAALLVPKAVRSLILPGFLRPAPAPSGAPTLTRWFRRRDDFLHLYYEFYNLRIDATGTRLVRVSTTQRTFVVVHFPPQYVLEEAIPVTNDQPQNLKSPPLGSRLAASTRLALEVPPFVENIPFTAQGLLTWDGFSQSVVPSASISAPTIDPQLRAPGPRETAIEVPWWLILSPSELGSWDHRTATLTNNGRTELWHTSLASSPGQVHFPDDPPPRERLVRGVWSRDPGFAAFVCARRTNPGAELVDFVSGNPLDEAAYGPKHIADIVLNSGDWETDGFIPTPVTVDTLALSALGAWISAEGTWEEDATLHPEADLISWRHRGVLGRDVYVQTAVLGNFFPFGHRAIRVDISEREPHAIPNTDHPAAYLFKRTFYIPLELVKDYPPPGQPDIVRQPDDGRALPFKRIAILTRTTPAVIAGEFGPPDQFDRDFFSVPTLDGPFPFEFVGTDHAGNDIPFKSPVIFVVRSVAISPSEMTKLADAYNGSSGPERAPVGIGSRSVALATPDRPGDTSVEVDALTFQAQAPGNVVDEVAFKDALRRSRLPGFWPAVEVFDAKIPAAERAAAGAPGLQRLRYDGVFLATGLNDPNDFASTNPGQVFALLDDSAAMTFGSGGRGGAVVNPDFKIDGLSRSHGPVAAAKQIQVANFQPSVFFAGLDAKLLGGVSLGQIIAGGSGIAALDRVPKLLTRAEGGTSDAPQRLVTDLRWSPGLQPSGHVKLNPNTARLDVEAQYVSDLANPERSTTSVVGDLQNVTLAFPAQNTIFAVEFRRIRFSSVNGAKPDLRVDLAGVEFLGPLKLVEKLRSFLGPALDVAAGQNGPSIDVTASSIEATYTLPVPAIEVGVFLLQNVTVTAGLHLPFGPQPVRAFCAFSSRENPFLITVSALGGGGYFALRAGADDIESVEGALEFGGAAALNLGVAKGSIKVLGGIYYKAQSNSPIALEGYVRMSGSLRVLGLITVSAQFYMALKWVDPKVVGKASLEVEIDMGLFSKSVTISVERRFAGDGADPSFRQLQDVDEWTEYCRAFASEVS